MAGSRVGSPTLPDDSHLVLAQLRVGALDAFLLEPHWEEVRVGHHDPYQARLEETQSGREKSLAAETER